MTTIQNISDSDDRVWEALCIFEDGDAKTAHKMIAGLSDTDKEIFESETHRMIEKRMRAAEYVKEDAAPVINCTLGTLEGAILDAQDRAVNPF